MFVMLYICIFVFLCNFILFYSSFFLLQCSTSAKFTPSCTLPAGLFVAMMLPQKCALVARSALQPPSVWGRLAKFWTHNMRSPYIYFFQSACILCGEYDYIPYLAKLSVSVNVWESLSVDAEKCHQVNFERLSSWESFTVTVRLILRVRHGQGGTLE